MSAEVVMDAEIESVMASSHDQREEELQVLNQCKHLSVVEKKMRCIYASLWLKFTYIEALSFGICYLPDTLTLLTQAFVTL